MRFFESLDRMVQNQPWLTRDKAMIDLLKSIGIEKGKPFAPDDRTRAVLEDAAREAHAWMAMKYEEFFPPMNQSARWALPASPDFAEAVQNNYSNPDSYPVDARGRAYSYAFFSAKHLGAGQYYLMTIRDRDGRLLDGAKNYRLTVPANAPVKQYWSATAYDRATHALIREHAMVQPRLAVAGHPVQCRRLGRVVLRPEGARWQGGELGADRWRRRIRSVVPLLRTGEGAVRQELGVARHRSGSVAQPASSTSAARSWASRGGLLNTRSIFGGMSFSSSSR